MTTDTLNIRVTKYVPQDHIDRMNVKQHAALWVNAKELMYGGAAGGGKSDFLLMAALQYVDVPEYAAIIFRKTYTDLSLPGALMDRAHLWLDQTDARWDAVDKRWEFPSGASLSFGYLKSELDKYRYQSAEFQYIAFDELTQFPIEDYQYLFSRLRGPAEGAGSLARVPLRMRSASNPGGQGHAWVKKRFIDKEWDPEDPDDSYERAQSRVFIPASLYDNEENVNVPQYEESLKNLDRQTRKQLLDGDWTARPPGDWYFNERDIAAAVDLAATLYDPALDYFGPTGHDKAIPPSGGSVYLGIDWGEHTAAYCIWPLEGGGVYIPPSEVVTWQEEPSEATRLMLVNASKFGYPLRAARYDAAGVQSMRTFLKTAKAAGYAGLKPAKIPFNQYKSEAAMYIRHLLERVGEGYETRVIAISPENKELIRQLPELESDPENAKRAWLKDEDQHSADALIAGVAPMAAKNRKMFKEQTEQAYKRGRAQTEVVDEPVDLSSRRGRIRA
jgi:hypothetical protein